MQRKELNFAFFYKKVPKNFASSRKSCTFAAHFETSVFFDSNSLGYGVMVTLQILVLPFLVRVRVPQPKIKSLSHWKSVLSDFFFIGINNH